MEARRNATRAGQHARLETPVVLTTPAARSIGEERARRFPEVKALAVKVHTTVCRPPFGIEPILAKRWGKRQTEDGENHPCRRKISYAFV